VRPVFHGAAEEGAGRGTPHVRRAFRPVRKPRRTLLRKSPLLVAALFCFLAVLDPILDPTVGHTMDVLSPFFSVLCHFY